MKKRKHAVISFPLAFFMLFTACYYGGKVVPASSSEVAPSGPQPQNNLERLLEKSGLKMEQTSFSRGYQVSCLENATAYIAANNDGGHWILLDFQDGSCYSIGCPYSFVDSVRTADQEGCVRIFTDGRVFGGDKIFRNFPGSYTVDLESGEVVEYDFTGINPSGLYGLERGGDKYRFGDCVAEGDSAVFTFEFTQEPTISGKPGTEIYIFTPEMLCDQKGRRAVQIFFNETEATLSDEFLVKLKTLPGIVDVTVQFMEDDFFRGTSLTLEYMEDYILNYSFNHGGYAEEFEDFVISCRRIAS